MTKQLILGEDLVLPESSRDKFFCWEEDLSVSLPMISGREVIESRGKVWKASYSFDYMGNELLRKVLAVLRSGRPFQAAVLPDDRDEMVSSVFIRESITNPTYAFSRGGVGLWHNLAFTIREERPHA